MTRLYTARGGQQLAMFPGAKPQAEGHENRGKEFEHTLMVMHGLYEERGFAVIRKNYVASTVMQNGKIARVEGPAMVDFSGPLAPSGRHVAFDAKDCKKDFISLERLEEYQAAYLVGVDAVGGMAFVLVRFAWKHVYKIPIRSWVDADLAHKFGVMDSYIDWTPTGLGRIRMSDCPEKWRVNGYDWLGVTK